MDAILGWIKPILYFSIFITVMLQLLPTDKYTKYIRFFAGLLMIVLVISPVFRLLGGDGIEETSISKRLYQEYEEQYQVDFDTMEREAQIYYENIINETIQKEDGFWITQE